MSQLRRVKEIFPVKRSMKAAEEYREYRKCRDRSRRRVARAVESILIEDVGSRVRIRVWVWFLDAKLCVHNWPKPFRFVEFWPEMGIGLNIRVRSIS